MIRNIHTALLLAVAASPTAAFCGEVLLNNGDRITGTITQVVDGKLTVESPAVGELVIPLTEIRTFTTDDAVDVVLHDGSVVKQKLSASEQPGTVLATGGAAADQTIAFADLGAVNPPDKTRSWQGTIRGGLLVTTGNSETTQANVGINLTRRTEFDRLTFDGQYLFGRQENADTGEDETTTDNWSVVGKYDYFFTDQFYVFALSRIERDRIANLDIRVAPSVGVGYQWLESDRTNFNTEAGLGWVYEDFRNDDSNDYFAARLAYHLDHAINERVTLFNNVEYIPSLERGDEFNVNADIGLRVSLTKNMFSEGKVEWKYDSQPAPGADKEDVRYILSVGWTF